MKKIAPYELAAPLRRKITDGKPPTVRLRTKVTVPVIPSSGTEFGTNRTPGSSAVHTIRSPASKVLELFRSSTIRTRLLGTSTLTITLYCFASAVRCAA